MKIIRIDGELHEFTEEGVWTSPDKDRADLLNRRTKMRREEFGVHEGDPRTVLFHHIVNLYDAEIVLDDEKPPKGRKENVY